MARRFVAASALRARKRFSMNADVAIDAKMKTTATTIMSSRRVNPSSG